MGDQRVIADNTHIIGNLQLREAFEFAADFLNLSATPNIPSSNTQYISSVCVSVENTNIPKKVEAEVDL